MSSSDQFQRLEQLFHELEAVGAEQRAARLAELAESEPELYPALLRMLDDSTQVDQGERLIDELIDVAGRITGEVPADPEQIGPYRLQQLIGEGGMGRVYLAEQSEPVRRRVALKLTRRGLDSAEAMARFRAERQALAVLEHPNIARVFDAGSTEGGRPWFAMEYIDGMPINRWAAERKLSLTQRIELLLPVCEAVQHAHAKGLVHRDLKPSNILVIDDGGIGRPMVIDFGIARVVDLSLDERTQATRLGELVGTPEYMSPEQASLGEIDIDTRSDIYSLGLVLYELLVGELPMTGRQLRNLGFQAMCQAIREGDTPRPSRAPIPATNSGTLTWRSRLKGDLDSVLLKALAKDRDQRYGTAAAFAEDLRRYLANEPVLAQPPSLRYRAGKFIRRHRLPVATAAIVALALVASTLIAGFGLVEARKSAQIAQQERDVAEAATAFLVGLFRAADPRESQGLDITAREVLERGRERIIDLDQAPAIRARLLQTLGDVYWSLGAFPEAEPLLLEGIALHGQADVHDPIRLAMLLNRLGGLRRDQDRMDEAEVVHRQAWDVLESAGQQDTLEAGLSLNQLAIILTRTGRLDEAAAIYEQAIALTTAIDQAGGEDSAQARQRLTNLQANLGALHHRRGDFAAARSAMLGALAQAQADLGPQHPFIGILHNNLARASFNLGALHAARTHADQALAVDRQVLDATHPSLAESLMLSGQMNLAMGDPAQAEIAFIESQTIVEQALGREHRFFYMLSVELGRLALLQGDGASAAGHFERAIEARQARPDYRLSVEDLAFRRYRAIALRQIGQLDQAGMLAEQALELAEQIDDPRGEKPLLILLLAQLAADQGDLVAARQYLGEAQAVAGCSSEAPCPALDGGQALIFRALVLAGTGDFEAAFDALEFAIDQPKWFPQMLRLPELASLAAHPRWPEVEARLAERVAADREMVAAATP